MGACQGYRQTSDDAPLLWFRARIPPFLPNVPSIFCLPVSLWPSYPLESSTKLFSFLTCGSRKCTERSYVVDCCLRRSTTFLQLVNMFDLRISYVQVEIIHCSICLFIQINSQDDDLLVTWSWGTYGTRRSPYRWLSTEDGVESWVEVKKLCEFESSSVLLFIM